MKDSDEWITPWDEFWKWDSLYHFTVDAASNNSNYKVRKHWTIEDNGLLQDWTGERVFCNPPYSDIRPWVVQAARFLAELSFLVLPANTDTSWFHDFIWDEDNSMWRPGVHGQLRRGRISFDNPYVNVSGPRYANLLVLFQR